MRILRKVKSNRQKLIKACDDLFRQIIRLRDKVCQVTGRKEKAQVAHFYTRGNLRVRWDEDNACLLNAAKHIWWAHANPEQFKEFWIKRIGERRFDVLTLKARYVAPVKEFDLICIREQLKNRLEELKNGK